MKQVEAAVIGTGWCGGIRAETLSRSALVDKLHICEIRPERLAEVKALTKPATAKYDPFIETGGVPMRRWGLPEDLGQTAVTLATGGLPFATGMHVDVDGGLQLHRL